MSEEIHPLFAGKLILVVEDNVDSQDLMRDVLERIHYHVDIAHDGAEAVEKWKKNKYDLILMDIQMPNMDGLQATSEIRRLENSKHRHTPIIALTASVLPEDRQKCFEAGVDGYMSKPIDLDVLEQGMRELLLKYS